MGEPTAFDHIDAVLGRVPVDVGFVLVHHRDVGVLHDLDLGGHPLQDLVAVVVDVLALGGVVAEHPDERRLEELGQFHGVFELVQMRLERFVQLDLADRRADRADLQTVVLDHLLGLVQFGWRFRSMMFLRLMNRGSI